MQALDWNDLRFVLALAREGSYVGAGRRLQTDPTTVSRRLRAAELALGTRLFERGSEGSMHLTEAGEVAARRAEIVEAEVGGLTAAVKGADSIARGTVRVTAVPILINHVLVPAVPSLTLLHPELRVELIAESRDLSLTRREADVALRLARPGEDIAGRILARRIGSLEYAVYTAVEHRSGADDMPWVTYEDGMAQLPQARWIATAAQRSRSGFSAVKVNDAEALLQAVQVGLGRSLLPRIVGDQIPTLARADPDGVATPKREIWLLTHPDLRHLARVSAVISWIETTIATAT